MSALRLAVAAVSLSLVSCVGSESDGRRYSCDDDSQCALGQACSGVHRSDTCDGLDDPNAPIGNHSLATACFVLYCLPADEHDCGGGQCAGDTTCVEKDEDLHCAPSYLADPEGDHGETCSDCNDNEACVYVFALRAHDDSPVRCVKHEEISEPS